MSRIHLQGIGSVPARPVEDVRPGDVLSWNYSYRGYVVVSIRQISPQFFELVERNVKTGETFSRRVKRGRLIAASHPPMRDPSRFRRDRARSGERFYVTHSRHGYSAVLIRRGRSVNVINGGPDDSAASVRAAARKHWPHAKEVRRG